jgi:hypothetical protein
MAICAVSGERFEVSQFEREYCLREGLPLPEISQRERLREEEPSESGPIQPLSDHVRDVSESSLKVPFLCEATGKRYKVLPQELRFHQRLGLALPRVAPLERLRQWSDFLAVHPVRETQCAHCGGGIQTARVEKSVLCEPCYQRHVTG